MEKLQCEICGSSDFIKSEDLYACQYCGMKYTKEQIQDLIGTVKVDQSDFVANQIANARRAKQKEYWPETEKNYDFVEQHQSKNNEDYFPLGGSWERAKDPRCR